MNYYYRFIINISIFYLYKFIEGFKLIINFFYELFDYFCSFYVLVFKLVFKMSLKNKKGSKMTKLSISIVAYNNYADIKKTLTTMEKYTNLELSKSIYIIDNGAAISSIEDVSDFKRFIQNMQDVIYLDVGSNIGFGKGHNQVLKLIDSEYHAIVNPDIIFCEDAFTEIIQWMDINSDVGMTIPLITDEQGNIQYVYRRELTVFDMFNRMVLKSFFKRRANKHIMLDMDYTRPFQVPFGQGSFLVIRSDLFIKLGGFDDSFFMYCEDADLCRRVNEISKLMYYPNARVIHKWEKGSHKNINLFKYHLASMKYYFKKWGWKLF